MKIQRQICLLLMTATVSLTTAAEFAAPNIVYVGCTVHDTPWRSDLKAWRHSRELIGTALTKWFGVGAERQHHLINPSAGELETFITETLPPTLQANDIVVFYLGAHHRKKGGILLGARTEIADQQLGKWLQRIPQRTLLLADVCFATRLEDNVDFPDNIMRVHGASRRQAATDLNLDGKHRKTKRFFRATQRVVNEDLETQETLFSIMGYICVHAMLQVRQQPNDSLAASTLAELMRSEQERMRQYTRRTSKTPILSIANPQSWLLAGRAPEAPRPLANNGREGLKVSTIDAMLALDEQDIDMGYGNLLIGKLYDPGIDLAHFSEQLDAMAYELRERIQDPTDRNRVAATMADYIFNEKGFVADLDPYDEDFLLHVLLETKHGRCSALVALYIALAERLDLPFQSVCIPEHIYIHWPASANGEALNIETTQDGVILADNVYVERGGGEFSEKGKKFYLQPQSKRQTLAVLLSPLGSALREKERYDEAITACQLAISINVHDAEAWNNLGMVYRLSDSGELARVSYSKALAINPDFAAVWNNLGTVTDDIEECIRHYKKAAALDPSLADAWQNLARAYFENGDYQLSLACVRRYHTLGYLMPQEFLLKLKAKM